MMTSFKIKRFWALLIGLLGLVGCQSGAPANTATPPFNESIAELNKLIEYPAPPQSVLWQTTTQGTPNSRAPGPTDWTLTAILHYDQATIKQLESQMTPKSKQEMTVKADFFRSWYPEAIKNAFVQDSADPNSFKLKTTLYEPTPFIKSPLLNGYVFVVDEYVYVYLFTM